jgi:hypothetical protein
MESITSQSLRQFFERLRESLPVPADLYLVGGSALFLLGSARETLVVDYFIETESADIKSTLQKLALELNLDLESVPLSDFIPLPPHAEQRHRLVGQFGRASVYIFDLYSIALRKIARGFESDLDDVKFLLDQYLIEWDILETHFQAILPLADNSDIDPNEFCEYFETFKQMMDRV